MGPSSPRGLFVGLATLDIIHRVSALPGPNEKVTALSTETAAGGPAANAAVAFAALGGSATLLTALGSDPAAEMVRADLAACGVTVVDAAAGLAFPTSVSSVLVTEASGERAVVGADARGAEAPALAGPALAELVAPAQVVLVDGHHPALAVSAAQAAVAAGIQTVLDAGRWKAVMEPLVPLATDLVASADFRVPGAATAQATHAALVNGGSPVVVTTSGADPVSFTERGRPGTVDVPPTDAVDTLGAGDVFHGAYAWATARGESVPRRIAWASAAASLRVSRIGARSWLPDLRGLADADLPPVSSGSPAPSSPLARKKQA